MTEHVKLRLGTRQSPLAVVQAEETRCRLCDAHGWPLDAVELIKVRATGDKIQDRPLADIGGKALWTRELDIWLAEGRIDAAVHSMKDVETLRPESLTIAAILPRADIRDVLIGAKSLDDIPLGARIGTSAPRRAAQMLHHRPDCTIVGFRGNVATRLSKLQNGEADVTLLAAAGLQRLDQMEEGTPLDPQAWIPAPAQGAIGVECNSADQQTRALLAAIDDAPSRAGVMAERALLEALGGTCHSPIAARSAVEGDMIHLTASLFSGDGQSRVDGEAHFAADNLDSARALGRDLLARATSDIRRLFESD